MYSEFLMKVVVVLLCGTGLAMLIPVTLAIVLDFVKGMGKIFKKG